MSDAPVPSTDVRFADIEGLNRHTVEALERRGMSTAFPVQAAVVPAGIRGSDLLVQSPTGSGKTLAFGLPIIERLEKNTQRPTALILVPTRELAVQVCEDLAPLATGKQLRCVAVYGGASIQPQAKAVRSAAIVVATPGRLHDLMRSKRIDVRGVNILVLDEADRMLDMGFQPQVDEIVDDLPNGRQTMLFSATLQGKVASIAATYTKDAEVVRTTAPTGAGGEIDHVMWATSGGTKVDTVLEALEAERDLAVVFVRTKRSADLLTTRLREHGVRATAIHGGMTQRERLSEYRRFQAATCDVLVATDVFARGMDLDRITLVINYDLPEDADTYRHRSGRTGRAGRTGTAVTMLLSSQRKTARRMIREAGIPLTVFDEVRHTKRTRREPLPVEQHYVIPAGPAKSERGQARRTDRPGGPGTRGPARHGTDRPRTSGGKQAPWLKTGRPAATHPGARAGAARPGGPGDGAVVSFDPAKGFGFIAPDAGGPDVFFHRASLRDVDPFDLRRGTRVAFGTQQHQRGVRAEAVELAGAPG